MHRNGSDASHFRACTAQSRATTVTQQKVRQVPGSSRHALEPFRDICRRRAHALTCRIILKIRPIRPDEHILSVRDDSNFATHVPDDCSNASGVTVGALKLGRNCAATVLHAWSRARRVGWKLLGGNAREQIREAGTGKSVVIKKPGRRPKDIFREVSKYETSTYFPK